MMQFNQSMHGEFNKRCKKVQKKAYSVDIVLPSKPTQVTNVLEGANYTAGGDSVIIRGTVGEYWAAPIQKILKTYCKQDGRPLSVGDIVPDRKVKVYTKKGNINYAMHIPVNVQMQVSTAWGDVLIANRPGVPHGNGDFLVCGEKNGRPDLSDVWVVNGKVFATTYGVVGNGNTKESGTSGVLCQFKNEQFHTGMQSISELDNCLKNGRLAVMVELVDSRGEGEATELYYSVRGNKVIYVVEDSIVIERSIDDRYKTVKGLAAGLYNATKREGKLAVGNERLTIVGVAVGVNGSMQYSVEMY